MTTKPLPKYDNPPLDEVVFGVTLEPLHRFKTPYIGLFWDRIRDRFPRCEQAPIIGNIDEIIDPQLGLPAPRVWLINAADDHLVQVQKNKFLFNWRKRKDSYPSFEPVRAGFLKNLDIFREFIAEQDLGDIIINNYELSYINIIPQGDAWNNLDDISCLFPDIFWRQRTRFRNKTAALLWQATLALPDNYGNLVILMQSGLRRTDNFPFLRLELSVRGFNRDSSPAGMGQWFDTAHEWIVLSFEDITDDRVQREVWKKHARS